jgi:hypothetical protein
MLVFRKNHSNLYLEKEELGQALKRDIQTKFIESDIAHEFEIDLNVFVFVENVGIVNKRHRHNVDRLPVYVSHKF